MATTPSMFEAVPFHGAAYDAAVDRERLTRQVDCIAAVALGGEWWTVAKLTAACRKRFPAVGFPECSVSAQIRNLKKVGYGVERNHLGGGLFEYKITRPNNPGVGMALHGGDHAL